MMFRESGGSRPWKYLCTAVAGSKQEGKLMTSIFNPLPRPATYFKNNADMLLDPNVDINVDYEHVIKDGVARGRYPYDLLERHKPRNIEWKDYRNYDPNDRDKFLSELSEAIFNDGSTYRALANRIKDAINLAKKRVTWNFKTAIPQYYPRYDELSLLIPLSIQDDEVVDLSMVVTKNPSGSYEGRTVFPLEWSYMNARLVCRPDSDWLTTDLSPGQLDEFDDQD
jgi:hypothetical protein